MTDRPQIYLKASGVNYKQILFGLTVGGRMFTKKIHKVVRARLVSAQRGRERKSQGITLSSLGLAFASCRIGCSLPLPPEQAFHCAFISALSALKAARDLPPVTGSYQSLSLS